MKSFQLLVRRIIGAGVLFGVLGCDASPPWKDDDDDPEATVFKPDYNGYYNDGYAYSGCHFSELAAVTFSKSYSPDYTLIASGDRAYAVLDDEIAIFDITAPESPFLVSGIAGDDFSGHLYFLEVQDTHIYAGDGDALYTFDYNNRSADPVFVDSLDTRFTYTQIAVSKQRIVLSGADWEQDDDVVPLLVYPLVDGVPRAPRSILVPDGHIERIALGGDHLFAEFITAGYAATPCLKVVDLSNPEAPQFGGCAALPGTVSNIQLNGNNLFVALDENDAGETLRVFDVSVPSAPALIRTFSAYRTADSVASDGRWVYVVMDGDVAVADLSESDWTGSYDGYTGGMQYYVAVNREADDGVVYLREYERLEVVTRCDPDASGE